MNVNRRRDERVLKRYENNPILKPIKDNPWESTNVFNCAATYEDGKIQLVYRAQGEDGISRLGYASTYDGFHIEERSAEPFLSPSGDLFELYGCEDPRITRIGERYYICYTAYGKRKRWRRTAKTRIAQPALTSISVSDFLNRRCMWGKRIYPLPQIDSKNCVLFPEKFDNHYVMYHRILPHIWVGYSTELEDWSKSYHRIVAQPTEEWEKMKIGAGAPPIRTDKGWLLAYHGVDENFTYRLGLAIVDLNDPESMRRLKKPILEPVEEYERVGFVPNVVFSCGAVVMDGKLFMYYGAADRVIGVATAELSDLLSLFDR